MARDKMQELIEDPTGLKKALREGLCPDRVIYVRTDGRSCEQFVTDLTQQGNRIGDTAKQVLCGRFVATNGAVYILAVIMGDEFENNAARTNQEIRRVAHDRGYHTPSVEVAPYLREMFSDANLEQMGLSSLIVMHEPITVSDNDCSRYLLGADRSGDGQCLSADFGEPHDKWDSDIGFVFQVRVM